jgi:LemA protein
MAKGFSTAAKIGIGIAIVLVLGVLWFIGSYNGLVSKDETANAAWADVEVQYQRRFDLIPNLVNTVKGYAAHEEKLFTEITALRSQWQTARDAGDVNGAITAARGADSAISRLLLVAENYPNLKASENFLSLQDELAGTENRVAFSRNKYNDAVKVYNTAIRRFPTNIVAGLFGFDKKTLFEAQAGSESAPSVSFT